MWGETSQRGMERRRRGGSFKDEQIEGSLPNESKLREVVPTPYLAGGIHE